MCSIYKIGKIVVSSAISNTERSVSPTDIDVSIILNVHREFSFLPRTLESIDEAVRYAKEYEIVCELVVVLDRPDTATRDCVSRSDVAAYSSHIVFEVDNGSLGLSRNDGIAAARGRYILTADADDLISYNLIAECVRAAASHAGPALYFPQYYRVFGADPHLYELHPLGVTTPHALFGYHPYVSRFFARRDQIADLKFADLRLAPGFAFEDWHFNLHAVAAGFDLLIVAETIVFYRKRAGSLQHLAEQVSNGVPPHSPFFDPPVFLKLAAPWLDVARAEAPLKFLEAEGVRRRFLDNAVCRTLVMAAALHEPAIDPCAIAYNRAHPNINDDRRIGIAYQALCEAISGPMFDDILLVPFLSTGGGEKYVLHVVLALLERDPDARLLIIAGEHFDAHAWLDRLPASVVFVDLYAIAAGLNEGQRQVLTLRAVQAVGPRARLHIKSCPYAIDFLRRFAPVLADNKIIYYRFCDTYQIFHGNWVRRGYEFDFLSDCGRYFHKIITDNKGIASSDVARLPHLHRKYTVLYNYVEDDVRRLVEVRNVQRRVLWASRLDAQKRPDLLPLIAAELERRLPYVVIDVCGSTVIGEFDLAVLTGTTNLVYQGAFDGFAALRPERYDILLYTSAFDGLPNIILEAMATGMVVIAPDIGGVSEAVTERTGVLIDGALPDDLLARAYADAIATCYDNPERLKQLSEGALAHIAMHHDKACFGAAVDELFGTT